MLIFRKTVDVQMPRFDKHLEEFYSICDQIELHLVSILMNHFQSVIFYVFVLQKTSIKCLTQAESSNRYLHLPVAPTRSENIGMSDNTLTYPQYLATVSTQVAYTKEIYDTLVAAAQNISPSD